MDAGHGVVCNCIMPIALDKVPKSTDSTEHVAKGTRISREVPTPSPSLPPPGGSKRSNEISDIDINGFWKYLGRIRAGRTAVNR